MNLRDIYGAIRLFFGIVWRPWGDFGFRVSIWEAAQVAKIVWLEPSTYCAELRRPE